MKTALIIVGALILVFLAFLAYACCVMAHDDFGDFMDIEEDSKDEK